MFLNAWAVQTVWMQDQSLAELLSVFAISIIIEGSLLGPWNFRPALPPLLREPTAPTANTLSHAGLTAVLGILGAWFLALHGRLVLAGPMLLVAAWAFSKAKGSPLTGLGQKSFYLFFFFILLVGAYFRLYRGGDIPAGMITVDEPRIHAWTQMILGGKRESFFILPGEGVVAFYAQALGIKIFGDTLFGMRAGSVFSGLIAVGLIGLLAYELGGRAWALAAAALTAVAQWPVTFSRAEYLMAASYLPILGFLWLFFFSLRRDWKPGWVLAGFCLGLCLNIYQAGKTSILLPVVIAACWGMSQPAWRSVLRRSMMPLLLGTLISAMPLILWFIHKPQQAFQVYFWALYSPLTTNSNVLATTSLSGKLLHLALQIPMQLPKVLTMFTIHGGMRPWYFIEGSPVTDASTLFLLLAGFAWALGRFKDPRARFLLAWWLLGLLPTLVSHPDYNMDERRIMMSLPPTLLLCSAGVIALSGLLANVVPLFRRRSVWLTGGLILYAAYGAIQWRHYFVDYAQDQGVLTYNHANFDRMIAAVKRELQQKDAVVITLRKPYNPNWTGSNPENELVEHWSTISESPTYVAGAEPEYFSNGGFAQALLWQPGWPHYSDDYPKDADRLIVLDPFHFYLEPLIRDELGGKLVAEVPVVQGKGGPNWEDVGFARVGTVATRIYRIAMPNPGKVQALLKQRGLTLTLQALQAPRRLEKSPWQGHFVLDPIHQKILADYSQSPSQWSSKGPSTSFKLLDPWLTAPDGYFPKAPFPRRLSAHWDLRIPADGQYRLGASSNTLIKLSIDGKAVFHYQPTNWDDYHAGQDGILGDPVPLKAGPHRFDMDQFYLNDSGNFNVALRLIWQQPGATIPETLPIELLSDR